ncbi:hypothetical protein AMAG_03671 [Allomyces macrogynus ATCC 38327]|uniref:DUF3844 domain-containing protein n=1 Tax=Allomyces macrogynus (strain ATCC 38327) TaxID=578462 RepID=A0A0L0SAC1_ALLM3|nr:hypothetical protein AMAG_03671 [Allomyces macrogynus ATCC 38327]|eukprot:KNE59387.1 hypothetical protein AMAG_03671 [Allomyces macrogynus ATCC 38327]
MKLPLHSAHRSNTPALLFALTVVLHLVLGVTAAIARITITRPTSSSTWTAGSPQSISWDYKPSSKDAEDATATVELLAGDASIFSSNVVQTFDKSASAKSGGLTVRVNPNVVKGAQGKFKVRVTVKDGFLGIGETSDTSDVFVVKAAEIDDNDDKDKKSSTTSSSATKTTSSTSTKSSNSTTTATTPATTIETVVITATPTATPSSENDYQGSPCANQQVVCRDVTCKGRQLAFNGCGNCQCGAALSESSDACPTHKGGQLAAAMAVAAALLPGLVV